MTGVGAETLEHDRSPSLDDREGSELIGDGEIGLVGGEVIEGSFFGPGRSSIFRDFGSTDGGRVSKGASDKTFSTPGDFSLAE